MKPFSRRASLSCTFFYLLAFVIAFIFRIFYQMFTDLYVIMHNYMPFCQEEVGEKMIFFYEI
ncbi:hypothetical protein CD798_02550 [Bacillaceae bacterium SAOS 7]|nr:hypothetical protein CD798_02550 [Bacillaceae bacterium SAOS 7]